MRFLRSWGQITLCMIAAFLVLAVMGAIAFGAASLANVFWPQPSLVPGIVGIVTIILCLTGFIAAMEIW